MPESVLRLRTKAMTSNCWILLRLVIIIIIIIIFIIVIIIIIVIVVVIIIIIRPELALDRPVSAASKVFQFVFVHLVYNAWLFLACSCCSFLLHVLANYICNFLVSRQLVPISTLPKFLHSFCGQRGSNRPFFRKIFISTDAKMFFLSLLLKGQISLTYKRIGESSVLWTLIFKKISGPNFLQNCCLEFPVFEKIFIDFGEFHLHKKFYNSDI